MDLRVSPITAALGPHATLAHAELAHALASAGLAAPPEASSIATLASEVQPSPPAPTAAAAVTASAAIISGLQSSLAQAGLMTVDAGALEMPMAPRQDLALAGPGSHTPAATEAPAAQPLTPAWITALQTPALRHGPWLQAPGQQPVRHEAGLALREDPDADADAADPGPGHDGEGESAPDTTAQAEADPGRGTATPDNAADPASGPGWPTGLPEEVQAELARGRSVLLVAPAGPRQRGPQLALLGVGARGQRQSLRLAAQGTPAATADGIDWLCWRVRREGEDGQRAVLTARHTALPSSRLHGLVLRATATREPPPLRPPGHAWLDILEPQRLWRALGSQWTVLLAWSPHALPGGER